MGSPPSPTASLASLSSRDDYGDLLTTATMSQRARRIGGGMTRAYGSRAALSVSRLPPPSSDATAAAVPGGAVEALLRDVLRAVRARARGMAPAVAASALRSLAELRLDDAATVRALLAVPLAPRRLLARNGGGGGGAKLGAVVGSLAALGHSPPPEWLAEVGNALAERRPSAATAGKRVASDVSSGGGAISAHAAFHLARSGWRPGPEAGAAVAGVLYSRLGQLSPVELTQAVQVRWGRLW
jgi:hypothetical protein